MHHACDDMTVQELQTLTLSLFLQTYFGDIIIYQLPTQSRSCHAQSRSNRALQVDVHRAQFGASIFLLAPFQWRHTEEPGPGPWRPSGGDALTVVDH
jgi:hypothetical protein